MQSFISLLHISICFLVVVGQFNGCSGRIRFVILTITDAPSIGVRSMLPGLNVSIIDMAAKFPTLYSNYSMINISIVLPSPADPCSPSEIGTAVERMSEIFVKAGLSGEEGTPVILTPSCPLPFTTIGDFARELNILTLACGPMRLNAERFPTSLLTFRGQSETVGMGLTALLDKFQWHKLSIMLDMVDVRVRDFLLGIMISLKIRMTSYDVLTTNYNSRRGLEEYPPALVASAQHSRVILIMTLDKFIRKILAAAADLDMTTGYYVYIYPYSTQIPFEPPIIWKYRSENITDTLYTTFESVLVIRFEPVNWDSWSTVSDRISQLRKKLFNGTDLPEEFNFNENVLGCYESVDVLSQNTADFNYTSRTWNDTAIQNLKWKLGQVPLDYHPCGYRNDQCPQSSRRVTTGTVGAVSACTVILILFVIWWIREAERNSHWWLLSGKTLQAIRVLETLSRFMPFHTNMKPCSSFLKVIVSLFLASGQFDSCSGRLRFIILTVSDAPSIGVKSMLPGFRTAISDMALKFPTLYGNHSVVNVNIDRPPPADPCSPMEIGLMIERMSDVFVKPERPGEEGTPVILTPLIGDFARELNILTLACGPTKPNPDRFPSSLFTFVGGSEAVGVGLTGLLDTFSWRKLSVMVDLVDARVRDQIFAIMISVNVRVTHYDVLTTNFNSQQGMEDYPNALRASAQHARVILIMTLDKFIRKILAVAADLDMTTGYYVFIYAYSAQIPFEPPITWKYRRENISEAVTDAFESVLVIRFEPINWDSWSPVSSRISQLRSDLYGTGLSQELNFNENVLGCYESMDILSQLMNESAISNSGSTSWQASEVIRSAVDRTFVLPRGRVQFSSAGQRIPRVVLQQYNKTSRNFETLVNLDYAASAWHDSGMQTLQWKLGQVPLDYHPCGYHNDQCSQSARRTLAAIVGTVTACVAVLVLLVVCRLTEYLATGRPDQRMIACFEK
ncbi:hypothetical protein BV898_07615 [Hypsibius exemplaris]|uniref:Receptor ligand binding region domain-containing protein n=1 Tax=Hypsibius exemplaris TaxID=2072580 RepID=A0A1W0WT91_HYPEX|nr:hypothetical protein BV898_07615 [Hypsibius exemplaris]